MVFSSTKNEGEIHRVVFVTSKSYLSSIGKSHRPQLYNEVSLPLTYVLLGLSALMMNRITRPESMTLSLSYTPVITVHFYPLQNNTLMKWSFLLCVGLLCCWACQPNTSPPMPADVYQPNQDIHKRDAEATIKQMTPVRAFLTLPNGILKAQGFQRLDKEQRRRLVRTARPLSYQLTFHESGLTLQAKPAHPDDENEALPTLRLQLFRHHKGSPVVFLSEEHVHERTNKRTLLQQGFWAFQQGKWKDISSIIPTISTASFFLDETPLIEEDHIYLDFSPQRPSILQAHLLYDEYDNPNTVFVNETYEVLLLWTGTQFELHREVPGTFKAQFQPQKPADKEQNSSAKH